MAITSISFLVREISNGYIVTTSGEEKFYPSWSDVVAMFFNVHPDDLKIDKTDKVVTFEVNHQVLQGK